MTVGFPDFGGISSVAQAVTSIVVNDESIAAQNVYSASGNIVRQGYEIYLKLGNLTHGSIQTPVLVELIWQEQATSQVTGYQRHWVFSGDSEGSHQMIGKGPSNGNLLTVTLTNYLAGTPTVSASFVVQDVARNYLWHDWMTRDTLGPEFPDYALAPSDCAANITCAISQQTVPAAGGTGILCPYRPGRYSFSFVNDGSVQLFPFIAAVADQGSVNSPVIWHESVPATAPYYFADVTLPNAQCTISVTNGSSTTAGKFDATLTYQGY